MLIAYHLLDISGKSKNILTFELVEHFLIT